jgi:diguanylate cyclase (GGDEF)-like protein
MQNFANRFEAEEYAVVEQGGALLTASETLLKVSNLDVEYLAQEGTTWFEYDNEIYLAKAVAVKNTPRSRTAMAWLVFAMRAQNLIDDELVRLTTMDVSLLSRNQGDSLEFIASTYGEDVIQEFETANLVQNAELQDLYLPSDHYIFLVSPLGDYDSTPVYLKLATVESNAYLSYYSLLGRLIGLLIVVSLIALTASILIANGITRPILTLVKLTQEIRQGVHVKKFPVQSTAEVNTLSNAIDTMQSAIIKREKEIQRLAFFDSVTMLPNRNSFIQRLEQQITESPDQPFSVVLLDIARFKEINDTIGHNAGDKLLSLVGERVSTGCREDLFIARLGGDEFSIIDANDGNTTKLMEELTSLFVTPFEVESLSLDIDVSIGGATYKEHGTTPSDLMQAADIALHTTKDSHKTFTLYHSDLNTFSLQRLRLMGELKDSLAEGQLSLYYQPKMSLSDDKIRSVECLIRWIHPEHGFIPPDDFIPLAEQTGAVRYITSWALRQAAIQHSAWREQGLDIAMAVNISAVDLTDLSLPYTVSALLSEFDMTPDKLIIEVTESAVMSDPQIAINALNMLSRMGIKLSIDDFGTGFSSMAQLKKMPVDEIKIDKAFVLELASNSDDQVMVKTLIAMSQNLGLSTVAEGVEDQDSVELLRNMGCSTAQGFHLSRPLPSKDITPWLEKANCETCG